MNPIAEESRGEGSEPESRFGHGCQGCLVALATIAVLLWGSWEWHKYSNEMARFPDRISIDGTVFQEEQSWGFGPGGNETGLAVYRLDDEVAERLIEAAPVLTDHEAIEAAMGRRDNHRNGQYYDWQRTPLKPASFGGMWGDYDSVTEEFELAQSLGKNGFAIDVDEEIAREVDEVLNSEGSYYAQARGGVIFVVAPEKRWVIFMYRG